MVIPIKQVDTTESEVHEGDIYYSVPHQQINNGRKSLFSDISLDSIFQLLYSIIKFHVRNFLVCTGKTQFAFDSKVYKIED